MRSIIAGIKAAQVSFFQLEQIGFSNFKIAGADVTVYAFPKEIEQYKLELTEYWSESTNCYQVFAYKITFKEHE